MTSIPAKLMGQEWRIGMVSKNYDADLVVWDRFPLDIGASPVLVYTDGIQTFAHPDLEKKKASQNSQGPKLEKNDFFIQDNISKSFKMINISYIYSSNDSTFKNGEIVVQNGVITCVGDYNACNKSNFTDLDIVDAHGGTVIPVIKIAYYNRG